MTFKEYKATLPADVRERLVASKGESAEYRRYYRRFKQANDPLTKYCRQHKLLYTKRIRKNKQRETYELENLLDSE
jgi:hypothetical protein